MVYKSTVIRIPRCDSILMILHPFLHILNRMTDVHQFTTIACHLIDNPRLYISPVTIFKVGVKILSNTILTLSDAFHTIFSPENLEFLKISRNIWNTHKFRRMESPFDERNLNLLFGEQLKKN
jgi:hypothetical protein